MGKILGTTTETLPNNGEFTTQNQGINFRRIPDFILRIGALAEAIVLCFIIYNDSLNYRFRKYSDDNIFEDNRLITSAKELERIKTTLEETFDLTFDSQKQDAFYMLNAALENKNLTAAEKQVLCKFINVIAENPYLNKEDCYQSILNVAIFYKSRPITKSDSILGEFYPKSNNIGIYLELENGTVLSHELLHSIYNKSLPFFFKEGMTELLNSEYFYEKPFSEVITYPYEMNMVRMLCELTSSDTVLKSFTVGDINIIANEIKRITGKDATEALEAVNYIAKSNHAEALSSKIQDINEEEVYSQFLPLFRECIELKYGSNEAEKSAYYQLENAYLNKRSSSPITKAYFSKELKEALEREEKERQELILSQKIKMLEDVFVGTQGTGDEKPKIHTKVMGYASNKRG